VEFTKSTWAAVGASLLLAACGGGGGGNAGTQNASSARGTLLQIPPLRTVSLTAADFSSELIANGSAGQLLLGLATAGTGSSALPCGVDVQYLKYATVGGKGEATQASAALMVPTGGPGCSGPRPIVLHAHGTAVEQRYNLADFIDSTNPAHDEQTLIASQWAAKGFIVVAPNYAGYDSSPLPYHPFLVADQQSKDMIDALAAARTALPTLLAPVSDNGKLFITGISEGGHAAMATFKAMRALNMNVTAIAPLEPVTAPLNYGDYIMSGHVPAASTLLLPMLLNGYQKTYGTLYKTPADYYTSAYAAGIEAAFPGKYSYTTLLTSAVVPAAALFSGGAATTPAPFAPLFAGGVGAGNLIIDSARNAYLADIANATPTHPLRVALKANDMLSLSVDKPMMLCGGAQDPTVFFSVHAESSAIALAGNPYVSLLDLEAAYPLTSAMATVNKVSNPAITALQAGFQQAKTATQAAAPTDPLAVVKVYHGSLAPTFCVAAASGYFANF
jgi:hypothetical protein